MLEYQRVIAQINLDNIASNVKHIRNSLKDNIKLMAIVKADAYGHGAVEVSKTALYNGADWLGVAICDEGVALRENNIHVPILILGYTPEAKIDEVIKNNLTQTVFSFETAKVLSDVATKLKKTVDVHIKIDTGMSRIGFLPTQENINTIVKISKLPNLHITGIFTHFCTADEKDKTFTYEQYRRFEYVCKNLEQKGIKDIIRHAANSACILEIKDVCLDMVRAGIIIYGLMPSSDVNKTIDIKPAMSLKTHISYVKTIKENTGVGYNRTYFTDKVTKIATVPVGYADGYSRILSNKARVIVNGQYANVIGNICMDQFMIDVTDIENVNVDDEVILMGSCENAVVSAEELARIEQTINYEIVCNVGKRVPRVYIKNNNVLKTINYIS